MRVALISLPWLDSHVPSAALAALAAYVRRAAPEFAVDIRPEHLEVARRMQFPDYRAIQEEPLSGEALYASLLYPEQRAGLAGFLRHPVTVTGENPAADSFPGNEPSRPWTGHLDEIMAVLDTHAGELARRLATDYDVAGFTASFRQLFANVLISRRLKALNPSVFVIWGGSLARGRAGPAFLREYPEIDCIVQGEGERPLVSLLRSRAAGLAVRDDEPGILTRGGLDRFPEGVPLWEAEDVAALPLPDFDSFAALANPLSVEWRLWIETARGCWWDRSGRTGNPRHRCLFCNMNQRRIYQAKPAKQVAAEVDALAGKYANPRVVLNDLSMRPAGITTLGRALAGLGRELSLQMEIRAGLRPRELLELREAGLTLAHSGIEGFSTAYLRRMGKGLTTIQNLELLKTCAELEIANPFGLVTDFPGSREEEVAESVRNIERFATAYPPPGSVLRFTLTAGSAVDQCRDAFGITNVRNHPLYLKFLPEAVCQRLVLPCLDWTCSPAGPPAGLTALPAGPPADWTPLPAGPPAGLTTFPAGPPADWTPLREACRRWREDHRRIRAEALQDERLPPKPLEYADGGDFLEITDYRGKPRRLHLTGPWREIYLACLEIRTAIEIETRFGEPFGIPLVRDILERCVFERIMFTEQERYLSLASASRPDLAARRIRRSRRK